MSSYSEQIWNFIPWWVTKLIQEGKANYGGEVVVKTPPELAGLHVVSIAIKDRELHEEVEKIAREQGYFPYGYRRWDNDAGGVISFCRYEILKNLITVNR